MHACVDLPVCKYDKSHHQPPWGLAVSADLGSIFYDIRICRAESGYRFFWCESGLTLLSVLHKWMLGL